MNMESGSPMYKIVEKVFQCALAYRLSKLNFSVLNQYKNLIQMFFSMDIDILTIGHQCIAVSVQQQFICIFRINL